MTTLDPIVRAITVPGSPLEAFEAFTAEFGAWWPGHTHSISAYDHGAPAASCFFGAGVGEPLGEVTPDGERCEWGRIEAWVPGELVRFTWQVGVGPERATEVEVRFRATGDDAVEVRLEHRGWQRLDEVEEHRHASYLTGWIPVFDEAFGGFVRARPPSRDSEPATGTAESAASGGDR